MTKIDKVYKVLSEKEIEQSVEEFRKWISEHPEFPQDLDNMLLVRYLNIFHYRMDKAQRLFKNALEFRARYPKVFIKRDPSSLEMTRVTDLFDMVPMHIHTKENYKICIFRLNSSDPTNIVLSDCVKGYFMSSDLRFSLPVEKLSDIECGEIIIFDLNNLTLQHFSKIQLTTVKLFFTYLQIGHPLRLIQFHAINCNSLINKLVYLIRPFISSRLFKTLKIHPKGSLDSLYEYVPKELLPKDYGGDQPTMTSIKEYYMKILLSKQEFFQNEEYLQIKKKK